MTEELHLDAKYFQSSRSGEGKLCVKVKGEKVIWIYPRAMKKFKALSISIDDNLLYTFASLLIEMNMDCVFIQLREGRLSFTFIRVTKEIPKT